MNFRSILARTSRPAMTIAGGLVIAFIDLVALTNFIRALVLPINQLTKPGGEVALRVVLSETTAATGLAGVTLWMPSSSGAVELRVADLPTDLRFLTEVGPALGYLGWAIGAWLLARALSSIVDGRPFAGRVVGAVAGLGVVLLLVPTVSDYVERVVANDVVGRVERAGAVIPYGTTRPSEAFLTSLDTMIIGLIVLLVAEAFRQGRKMSAELEGLV